MTLIKQRSQQTVCINTLSARDYPRTNKAAHHWTYLKKIARQNGVWKNVTAKLKISESDHRAPLDPTLYSALCLPSKTATCMLLLFTDKERYENPG